MTHDVCIIGAGWSGLTAAREIGDAGLSVILVEKARGPGGRSATRRQHSFVFDHGGQYFTARSEAFAAVVRGWQSEGLVALWQPGIKVFGTRPNRAGTAPAERFVAAPGMNAVLKSLSTKLDCRFGWRAQELNFQSGFWRIKRNQSEEIIEAKSLILTAPPEQSADLLRGVSTLSSTIAEVPMNPCWALMLGFDRELDCEFDAAFDNEGPLAWLARNSSKPGRAGEAWVLHASAEWSRAHLEDDTDRVARALLDAFYQRVPAARANQPSLVQAHRWRYALAPEPLAQDCLADPAINLVVAGDWCAGNRIEGAWTSGQAAARRIVERL